MYRSLRRTPTVMVPLVLVTSFSSCTVGNQPNHLYCRGPFRTNTPNLRPTQFFRQVWLIFHTAKNSLHNRRLNEVIFCARPHSACR
ncbi:hypothetical protein GGR55DRAFT_292023 [Xylaria sp. FL0064]|nr:hypothetical protein GGR55DRAFT_292023 [Xylaria sp. FL0064]